MRLPVRPTAVLTAAVLTAAAVFADAPASMPTTLPAQAQAFDSPDAAADAFVAASRSGDTDGLVRVLGKAGADVVSSGDQVADVADRQWFCSAYDEKHTLQTNADGSVSIVVGQGEWPMPLPIVKDAGGQWRFNAALGRDEILNRRIGRDELATIDTLKAICDAQAEYAAADPQHFGLPVYAERFASHADQHDGLYWPTQPGEPQSPLGPLIDQASDEGYPDPATQPTTSPAISPKRPYHGYYFRVLTAQGEAATGGEMDYRINGKMIGGFAVIAWPADYGNSGVMTFMVNQQGVVYQRNLGEKTADEVKKIKAFNPTPEWAKAEDGK